MAQESLTLAREKFANMAFINGFDSNDYKACKICSKD
jgi:hypothetical protein